MSEHLRFAIGGKRVLKQWATALRAYHAYCIASGTPPGIPPSYWEGQKRICGFIYERGFVGGLRIKTIRKYVGAIFCWWRLLRPECAPPPNSTGGMYELCIARCQEFDKRLPQQYALVTVEMLLEAIALAQSETIKAAVSFGFGLLARTSEYVKGECTDDWDRNTVRAGDIEYIGTVVGARSVKVKFSFRKNNTASMGAVQFSVRDETDSPACVVKRLFAMRDERRAMGWGDAPADGPIFLKPARPPNSALKWVPLEAADVANALRDGARSLGLSTVRLSAYGLRIGGATQLKRAGIDEVLVMLAGGWASVAGMRGYARDVPEDHGYLGAVLTDLDPTASAKRRRSSGAQAAAPAAKRAHG